METLPNRNTLVGWGSVKIWADLMNIVVILIVCLIILLIIIVSSNQGIKIPNKVLIKLKNLWVIIFELNFLIPNANVNS